MSVSALMVAGAEVRVNGVAIADEVFGRLLEVRVQHTLMLPSSFALTFRDPELHDVDDAKLSIGAKVEVLLAAPEARSLTSVLKGEVVALEPEFTPRGATMVVRGYDATHRMHRTRKSRTFQQMSVGDIARKVISENGLRAGTIEPAGGTLEFVQQSAETDWQLLWRLARGLGLEVVPKDDTLHVRKPVAQGSDPTLEWGQTLLAFRPRLSGMQQVGTAALRGFDPLSGQTLVGNGSPKRTSSPTNGASTWSGTTTELPGTPGTSGEATARASAIAARLGEAHVEAEGTCIGAPALGAGTRVTITGVGTRFGGQYRLSGVTHVFRTTGYETHFSISGAATRGLLDLMAPEAPPDFGASLAIGVVTNNQDPQGLARIRVKYPGLGNAIEGTWARVAVPQANGPKGLLMLPLVNDEVVVGFEGGDPRRPYVLGSVWNGAGKPGPLSNPDGSHSLVSPKAMTLTATEGALAITAKKGDLSVKAESGKVAQSASTEFSIEAQTIKAKATSQLTAEAAQASVKAAGSLQVEGATVTVKGTGSVVVEAAGSLTVKGATVTVQGTGMVRVSAPQIMLG